MRRITLNLSARGEDALDAITGLTGDSKTEAVNKALQAYAIIQQAQTKGGGMLIQDDADANPTYVRFY